MSDIDQVSVLRIEGRSPETTIMQLNDGLVGLDDGSEIHVFDRSSLAGTIRVRTMPAASVISGALRFLPPRMQVITTFSARPFSGGRAREVEVVFTTSGATKAKRIRKDVASLILAGDNLSTKGRSAARSYKRPIFKRLRTAAAVGIVAFASYALYAAALNMDAVDHKNVIAWGTEHIKPYGAIDEFEFQLVAKAAEQAGLDFKDIGKGPGTDATPFYVFSRLGCEECATIEQALPLVDPKFAPVILPAGIAASSHATLGAIQAYCSNKPTLAWLKMSVTGELPRFPDKCEGWEEKVNAAQIAHTLSGLDDLVPAIVAPNGAVYDGSLEHVSFADRGKALTAWLEANLERTK